MRASLLARNVEFALDLHFGGVPVRGLGFVEQDPHIFQPEGLGATGRIKQATQPGVVVIPGIAINGLAL